MVTRKTPAGSRNQGHVSPFVEDTNDSFYNEEEVSSKRPRLGTDEDAYPSPGSETASESDLERLGRGVKDLIQAINKLEVVGVEDLGLSLPKIVAVGDQSAGKSSLIEAISDIRVPRSNSTCTRCPIHITLESSDSAEWICEVSLLKKYDYYSRDRHGWHAKQSPEKIAFTTVKDKDKLGEIISAAQLAILNPSKNPLTFVTAPPTNKSIEVEFSKNVINLAIRGPKLPNLSFYDLPGIINQVENSKDEHLIDMVKELVEEHIQSPEAIVLLACSMESDIHNCNAARVVRNAGADNRCLCVLTKPDRLPQSEPHDIWRAVLEGKKFPFKYGYHVVRNPGQWELEKYNHSDARKMEAQFFRQSTPWHTPSYQKHEQQFGTANLQNRLSDLLTSHIKKSLPQMRQIVADQLMAVEEELAKLPEPPTDDSSHHVYMILRDLDHRLARCIDGEDPELKEEWETKIEEFATALTDRKPGLNVQSRDEAERKKRAKEIPIILDAEEDEPITPTPNRYRNKIPVTPTTGSSANEMAAPGRQLQRASLDPRTPRAPIEGKKTFTLDDVRDRLEKRAASYIGRFEHPKAIEAMIKESQAGWKGPLQSFSRATKLILENNLSTILQDILQDRSDTELAKKLPDLATEYLETAFDKLDAAIIRDHRSELIRPMIHTRFNRTIQFNTESDELKQIEHHRLRVRQDLYWDEIEPASGRVTSGADREKKLANAVLDRDAFEHEIQVMAKVRGYYLVASHRLVDTAARTIFNELFDPVKRNLHKYLCDVLGIHGPDSARNCQQLLADDPEREEKRQRLQAQQAKLQDAKRQLQQLA